MRGGPFGRHIFYALNDAMEGTTLTENENHHEIGTLFLCICMHGLQSFTWHVLVRIFCGSTDDSDLRNKCERILVDQQVGRAYDGCSLCADVRNCRRSQTTDRHAYHVVKNCELPETSWAPSAHTFPCRYKCAFAIFARACEEDDVASMHGCTIEAVNSDIAAVQGGSTRPCIDAGRHPVLNVNPEDLLQRFHHLCGCRARFDESWLQRLCPQVVQSMHD